MEVKLLNDSVIGSFDPKSNTWIYKANPVYTLKVPFKKDGTLKQHLKDLPRFNCIIEAEKDFMNNYDKELKNSILEMSHVLNSFGH